MNASADQEALFRRLLDRAAGRAAAAMLAGNDGIRLPREDGVQECERLELSPFADDQLLAVALRLALAGARTDTESLRVALAAHFAEPAMSLAVTAQRQEIWSGTVGAGLPLDQANQAALELERQLGADTDHPAMVGLYAALYADLWCDPRIGAAPPARRIMLAMVTALHAHRHSRASGGAASD